jgi:pilus assembly protein Flp/PilA
MCPGLAVKRGLTRSAVTALRADDSGATAIEYALIAGLISVSILIWAMSIGTSVSGFLTSVANNL